MDKVKDNLLWKENPSNKNKSIWANDSCADNKIEQSIDWIFKETFIDKLGRLFNHRNKYDRKVLNRNGLSMMNGYLYLWMIMMNITVVVNAI